MRFAQIQNLSAQAHQLAADLADKESKLRTASEAVGAVKVVASAGISLTIFLTTQNVQLTSKLSSTTTILHEREKSVRSMFGGRRCMTSRLVFSLDVGTARRPACYAQPLGGILVVVGGAQEMIFSLSCVLMRSAGRVACNRR